MNLIATNVFTDRDSEVYNITMKVDTRRNTTLTTFKVDNEKLPFDEHYNATISVYNPPSNLSNQLICFNLSKLSVCIAMECKFNELYMHAIIKQLTPSVIIITFAYLFYSISDYTSLHHCYNAASVVYNRHI